jgi:signal transduction histidine kinase
VFRQGRARREREILSRQLIQANQELQRRVRELTTIFAVGKAVITITNQQSLFEKIIDGALFVSEADSAWMMVRDERNKNFILRACRNVPTEILTRINQPFDDGLSSLVALSGENLSIHGSPLKRFKVARLAQAALVVPVKVRKEVVGLLVVARKTPQPFTTNQQALLEAVADYASISLVNTRLFRALEERVNVLQQSAINAKIDEDIKGGILRQASQELREPLEMLKNNVDSLLSKDIRKLSPEQQDVLTVIQNKIKTLVDIAGSMASVEQGEKSKRRELIDLNALARQSIGSFQTIARQNQTSIQADLPSKPTLTLVCPSQISKVIDGFLSNALKHSQPRSQITLRVESKENLVLISVQDNGIGIEAKHIDHLFEKAYKIDGAPSGRFGGVGISLPLIKEIIDAHGGKVWAESQPGKGSNFYFSLPRMVK